MHSLESFLCKTESMLDAAESTNTRQAEAHSRLVRDEAETGLEFIRAEGCDEGFSGEVRELQNRDRHSD